MGIVHQHSIDSFFNELLADLNCQQDTRAYIVSIYQKYKTAEFDLSNDKVGELFCQARLKQNFLCYQNLGDWLFFTKSIFPNRSPNTSENYYDTIAQLSYYNCYRMIKSWKLFQELADQFIVLTDQVRDRLPAIKIPISWDKSIVPYDF